MKELSFNEMEVLEGGWSLSKCGAGVAAAYFSGAAGFAGAALGPAGFVGSLALSCAVGGFL